MQVDLATREGHVSDEQIEHYSHYAKYCGLVIIEHTAVSEDGRLSPVQLGIWSDEHIKGLKRLASSIHENNGVTVIQLNHCGGKAQSKGELKPKAPSRSAYFRRPVEELKIEEIERIIEDFGEAAERAMVAGFDGVEIHGAHGFLISQFLSPITNKREDEYGGSLENRAKLALKIVERVKKSIDKDAILMFRLGVTDLMNNGITLNESMIVAKKLAELSIDILDVSGGLCGSRPKQLENKVGYWIDMAHEIRKEISKPILSGGGIRDPITANEFIEKGYIDLVFIGRAQLDDPDWARKAIEILKKSLESFDGNNLY
jgi:2,4-dienoyl-CoA reductase-like NADH-dependent reductase (Old Yellow Enzyme family)